jgi:enolase
VAAPAEGAHGTDPMAYSKSGVGGDSGCLLQVVADFLVQSAEDVQKLKQSGGAFNAVKIRLDKVSSVSKAVALYRAARDNGYAVVVGCSESTPETLDTFIADFAVAIGAGQLAAGGIASGEHFCKYSRLSEIAVEDPSIPFTAGDSFRL